MTRTSILSVVVSRLAANPTSECVDWPGAIGSLGYGETWFGGRACKAHRVVYEQMVGEVADGLELDHLCRNRACVNPDHLEPVTRAENVRRSYAARFDYDPTATCPSGHARSATNTHVRANGTPSCRPCRAAAMRLHRSLRRAAS